MPEATDQSTPEIQSPAAPVKTAPAKAVPVKTAPVKASVDPKLVALRGEYESLAEKCTQCAANGKKVRAEIEKRVQAEIKKSAGDLEQLLARKRSAYLAWDAAK